jgi:hypothetical protein
MESANNIERMAIENLSIAKKEKELANISIAAVKYELNKAKARESLVKNEIDLVNIGKKLAVENAKFVQRKQEVAELLKLSDSNLAIEKDYATYYEQVMFAQIEIAEVHRKMAKLEKKIAHEKIDIFYDRIFNAKQRERLSKFQFACLRLLKSKASQGKILKSEAHYKQKQEAVTETENQILEKTRNLIKKENKISDLKKELSERLSEREKIRPSPDLLPGTI